MNYLLVDLFSYSILAAGIIALVRYRRISDAYHPFIYLVWIGCLNEMLSDWLILRKHHTVINNDIYFLIEALLIFSFFRSLGQFKRYPWLYYLLFGITLVFWTTESIAETKFLTYCFYFEIFYSFVAVLLSINRINYLVITEERSLIANGDFLICIGFIIYYTYNVLVSAFWLYDQKAGIISLFSISNISIYLNLLTNLLFAAGLLLLPRKQLFKPLF